MTSDVVQLTIAWRLVCCGDVWGARDRRYIVWLRIFRRKAHSVSVRPSGRRGRLPLTCTCDLAFATCFSGCGPSAPPRHPVSPCLTCCIWQLRLVWSGIPTTTRIVWPPSTSRRLWWVWSRGRHKKRVAGTRDEGLGMVAIPKNFGAGACQEVVVLNGVRLVWCCERDRTLYHISWVWHCYVAT